MTDHSITYSSFRIKDLVHRWRLSQVLKILKSFDCDRSSICDVGCSNGYITKIVNDTLKPELMVGFDYTDAIDFAKKKYSGIEFEHLNLNNNNSPTRTFDIVYCLETIEHVGDVNTALDNLLALSRSNGKLLISVPVEIGFWGVVKFLLKTFIYRYPWELDVSRLRYFISLVVGDRVDVYRSQQPHFSSHFGFDYRIIDDHLDNTNVNYNGYRSWTTKFYIIDG